MLDQLLFIISPTGFLTKPLCQKAIRYNYRAICLQERWQASLYAQMEKPHYVILIDTPENNVADYIQVFFKKAQYFYQTIFILISPEKDETLFAHFSEKGLTLHYHISMQEVIQNPSLLFQMLGQDKSKITTEDFRNALSGQQLLLYYQPKIDLPTHRIYGAEGLLRWEHPEKGLILPHQMLSIIEQENLHEEITLFVIEKALHDIQLWSGLGIPSYKISVNVPAICMTKIEFYNTLFPLLDRFQPYLSQLIFEVTEQTVMSDLNPVKEYLQKIADLKIKLSIDDFGTGHSSLLRLMDLPFSEIKIERAMVTKLPEDEKSKMILEVILDIAQKMNMTTCAEGIETKEQARFLTEIGCTHGQGYLYSPALPPKAFLKWLTDYNKKLQKETQP